MARHRKQRRESYRLDDKAAQVMIGPLRPVAKGPHNPARRIRVTTSITKKVMRGIRILLGLRRSLIRFHFFRLLQFF